MLGLYLHGLQKNILFWVKWWLLVDIIDIGRKWLCLPATVNSSDHNPKRLHSHVHYSSHVLHKYIYLLYKKKIFALYNPQGRINAANYFMTFIQFCLVFNNVFSLCVRSSNTISGGILNHQNGCMMECPQPKLMPVAPNILGIVLPLFPSKDSINTFSDLCPCNIWVWKYTSISKVSWGDQW